MDANLTIQNLITNPILPANNITDRVLKIRTGNDQELNYGTGVLIPFDEDEYFVTASHNLSEDNQIEVYTRDGWQHLPIISCHKSSTDKVEDDFAVLKLSTRIYLENSHRINIVPCYSLAQMVILLGFPFGVDGGHMKDSNGEEQKLPLPLAKFGIVSAMQSKKRPVIVIDALGNKGFSGGPVITNWTSLTTDTESPSVGEDKPVLLGIISSRISEPNPKIPKEFWQNSGLIQCVPITAICDFIREKFG